MDEKAQLSAEMILLIGAILVIVIVAGTFIYDITDSIASNITGIIDTARDNTINRM
ncbi:MAG: Class III signal peptide [Methanobacterium sp. PtaB.Bin024]|nr:MAG: Class III signal peptide [Methanobacterium sp. PtaB.Bin024]